MVDIIGQLVLLFGYMSAPFLAVFGLLRFAWNTLPWEIFKGNNLIYLVAMAGLVVFAVMRKRRQPSF